MSPMKETKDGIAHYRLFIAGQWVDATSDERIEVENPTNEEIFATVQAGNAQDADRALEAARAAQTAWSALPAVERGNHLIRLTEKLREKRESFARLLTQEQGKTYALALGEVDATIDYINFPAQCARRIEGDIYPSDVPNEHIWIHRVPYGVTVALVAWNFPLALAGRKLGPALAAGNTMVVMAPPQTPVTVMEFADLVRQSDLPPGVLNFVTGWGPVMGQSLATHALTRLVTMTGSVATGRKLFAMAAPGMKAIRLELGGKAPFIVMEDADVDRAVEAAMVSRYLNCGQVCTCSERFYLHDAVHDEFVNKFVEASRKLKIGDPMEAGTDIGPKVTRTELEKVEGMVQQAVEDGCRLVMGGKRPEGTRFEKGHWYEPTVLTGATHDMAIMREEIFGPVSPIAKVSSFDEALGLANDSDMGLAAYLFTNDMRRIHRAVQELEAGEIYVNRSIGEQRQGFHNGFKLSGVGGEDGKHGFENYLRKKTFYVNYSS